jgi:hypothetical protein
MCLNFNPLYFLGLYLYLFLPYVDSASNEMSTRNLKKPGDKGRPARRADNLAAIC